MERATTYAPREANPAKVYLGELRMMERRRDAMLDKLDRLREATERATGRASATRLSGTGSHGGMEGSVIRLIDGERELEETIAEIGQALKERLAVIKATDDERVRTVLQMRYVNGWSWDKIAEKTHYERRQVLRYHGYGLKSVRIRLNI